MHKSQELVKYLVFLWRFAPIEPINYQWYSHSPLPRCHWQPLQEWLLPAAWLDLLPIQTVQMYLMEPALVEKNKLDTQVHETSLTNKTNLLSAVVRGRRDATALVTEAAISLCPLLSTDGSLRLSAGARPSVGKLVSTEACWAAAWASCSCCCCCTNAARSCWVSMMGMVVVWSPVASPSSEDA